MKRSSRSSYARPVRNQFLTLYYWWVAMTHLYRRPPQHSVPPGTFALESEAEDSGGAAVLNAVMFP